MSELEAIGRGLTAFGAAFFVLGIFIFINRKLLVTADILILLGLVLALGFRQFFGYLFSRERLKGTTAFLAGAALIVLRLGLPGVICEIVGLYWLFGGFIPIIFSLLSRIPIIGWFFPSQPKKDTIDV
jgi:maltodextrin utilization protein YvdJ